MVPSKIKIESFAKRYHMGTLGGKGLKYLIDTMTHLGEVGVVDGQEESSGPPPLHQGRQQVDAETQPAERLPARVAHDFVGQVFRKIIRHNQLHQDWNSKMIRYNQLHQDWNSKMIWQNQLHQDWNSTLGYF